MTLASHRALRIATLFDQDAIIAGGFVRDEWLGVEPKDIDVFLHARTHPEMHRQAQAIRKVYMALGYNWSGYMPDANYDGVDMPLYGVLRMKHPTEMDVDFVWTEEPITPAGVFATFDIGLCMIASDEHDNIYRAQWFDTDVRRKELTVFMDRRLGQEEQTLAHVARIKAKYPAYEVVIA